MAKAGGWSAALDRPALVLHAGASMGCSAAAQRGLTTLCASVARMRHGVMSERDARYTFCVCDTRHADVSARHTRTGQLQPVPGRVLRVWLRRVSERGVVLGECSLQLDCRSGFLCVLFVWLGAEPRLRTAPTYAWSQAAAAAPSGHGAVSRHSLELALRAISRFSSVEI